MESTAMGLVRGTLIVAFVLGLPAIAFFGVPDEVRTFLDADFLPWNSTQQMHAEHATGDDHAVTAHDVPEHQHQPQPPSFFARTDSIQADYESQSRDDGASRIALASAEARVLHQPIYRPLGSEEKSEVVRHVPTVDGALQGAAPARSDASVVLAMEARLRQLGALNYQLQQQAGQGQYRFVCICENERGEQRTFEALSEDRLQAMQTVLGQVSTWRNETVFSYFIGGTAR